VDVTQFLDMRRDSPDDWTFTVTDQLVTPGRYLFGGCGLAAGIVALEGASNRPTIWASAQYLSYATLGTEVRVSTELLVEGGHVTQARATARVDEREILTVNAALGTGTLNAPPTRLMPDVPDPEQCPELESIFDVDGSIFAYVDCRRATLHHDSGVDGADAVQMHAIWSRIPGHLEPSAATLAIFGDFVAGGVSQLLGRPTRGRSLDNTIRTVTLEPTEWVLCEIRMHALSGGFAQGTAFLWSRTGTLLATASQSIAAMIHVPASRARDTLV
jgi:acyl-CoA thioesterase